MVAAVILPGVDGSGALRSDFAQALQPCFEPILVSYPADEPHGYDYLERFVLEVLPRHEPFVLVGESFSGPLACRLAAARPRGLVALFLCASFAKSPLAWLRPFAWAAAVAPFHAVPSALLSWSLLGKWASSTQIEALQVVLRQTPESVLRLRAIEALRSDETSSLHRIAVPTFGLRAKHDRVVSSGASAHLAAHLARYTEVQVEGPHALLQAVPVTCAERVTESVRELGGVF